MCAHLWCLQRSRPREEEHPEVWRSASLNPGRRVVKFCQPRDFQLLWFFFGQEGELWLGTVALPRWMMATGQIELQLTVSKGRARPWGCSNLNEVIVRLYFGRGCLEVLNLAGFPFMDAPVPRLRERPACWWMYLLLVFLQLMQR